VTPIAVSRCILLGNLVPLPTAAPILLHTRFRPPNALGPDRIIRLASEVGAEGLAADESVPQDRLKAVATEGLRAGLAVTVAACPLAETELPKGKRLPHLNAFEDPEERRAAVKRSSASLAFCQQLGIPRFTVDLGPVPLRSPEAPFRLGYARREMSVDEPGGKALRRALEERRARSQPLYDATRASLEPLLAEAERRGSTLLLRLAAGPWELPTPREAHLLLHEFAGAPLGLVYTPSRRAVLTEIGLSGPVPVAESRWADLAAATGLIELTDRVGLETGLTLGTGELRIDLPAQIPAHAAWMVAGPMDASFREILRARRQVDELRSLRLAAKPA
jgi:hypothetical protein